MKHFRRCKANNKNRWPNRSSQAQNTLLIFRFDFLLFRRFHQKNREYSWRNGCNEFDEVHAISYIDGHVCVMVNFSSAARLTIIILFVCLLAFLFSSFALSFLLLIFILDCNRDSNDYSVQRTAYTAQYTCSVHLNKQNYNNKILWMISRKETA